MASDEQIAITKPAGRFMVIFSAPLMLVGHVNGVRENDLAMALGMFGPGLLLFYLGASSADRARPGPSFTLGSRAIPMSFIDRTAVHVAAER